MWNRLVSNHEEILLPLLAVLKAVPGDSGQEREIEELKKQSHMLRKVLADGDIGSAIFIEKRNRIDTGLDAAYQRQQLLKEQKIFEQEIAQTEYLLAVFRNRPEFIEIFDEERFLMIITQVTVYPDRRLGFKLKNGLELEESYGKVVE